MGHGRNDLVCSLYEPLQTQPPGAEVTGRIAFLFQVSHRFLHTALSLFFRLKAYFPNIEHGSKRLWSFPRWV